LEFDDMIYLHPGNPNTDRDWLAYYERRYPDPYAEAESLICADDQVTITDIGALESK